MAHVPREDYARARAAERRSAPDARTYPDTGDETGAGPDSGSAAGTPRWIKVVGIVIAVLVVLMFVVMHLTGAVGPGAHQ